MAVFLNNKVVFTIGGVDLSDHVTSVSLNRTFDQLETTAMTTASSAGHTYVAGLEASSLTVSFLLDNATSEVNQTIGPLVGTVAAVTLKQTGDAVSASNPEFQFIMAVGGEIFDVDQELSISKSADGVYAAGSGAAYALGAIYAGADAYEAMEIASKLTAFTAGPYISKEQPKKIK